MSYVFDSNILIYQLSDTLSAQGAELLRKGLLQGGAYSVISRIEIMGYPQSPEELAKADQLLRGLREIPLNDRRDCTGHSYPATSQSQNPGRDCCCYRHTPASAPGVSQHSGFFCYRRAVRHQSVPGRTQMTLKPWREVVVRGRS